MRVSSVMCPASSWGTLKSTRTSARLPRTSMSSTVFLFMAPASLLETLLAQELQQIGAATGIAPLVVVPGHDLDQIAADGDGIQRGVDGRVRVALQIGGYQRQLGVLQDAFH